VDLQLNDLDHAVQSFQEALKRNPNLPDSLDGLGKVYFKQGKFELALRYYQKAEALGPKKADYHYQVGQAYLKLGNKVAAQREFAETQKLQGAQLQQQQNTMQSLHPNTSR